MYVWRIARALTRETKHPIWGELFKRMLSGELTAGDIFYAGEIGHPHPQWVDIIAGANPAALPSVADFALGDFLDDVMLEIEAIENMERAMYKRTYGEEEEWQNAHLN